MLKILHLIFGIYHPRRILKSIRAIPWYRRTRREFLQQAKSLNIPFSLSWNYPCLEDRDEEGGVISGHYFHQDLLVAQAIFEKKPQKHVDIGSRIDGFVAHVASFREIEVMDVRQLSNTIPNVKFVQADCMASITNDYRNYTDSISSLHVIEHFGLGRYGDPVDAEGHLKGLNNIYNMLQPGGTFYFSVPIGPQRVEFNAHRVFSLRYLLDYFDSKYHLESFSYVNDVGRLHRKIYLTAEDISNNYNCKYGCGIFILKKN